MVHRWHTTTTLTKCVVVWCCMVLWVLYPQHHTTTHFVKMCCCGYSKQHPQHHTTTHFVKMCCCVSPMNHRTKRLCNTQHITWHVDSQQYVSIHTGHTWTSPYESSTCNIANNRLYYCPVFVNIHNKTVSEVLLGVCATYCAYDMHLLCLHPWVDNIISKCKIHVIQNCTLGALPLWCHRNLLTR